MCASRCASHKECGIKSIWMSSFRVWSLFRASDMFVTLCLCMCVGVWCGVVTGIAAWAESRPLSVVHGENQKPLSIFCIIVAPKTRASLSYWKRSDRGWFPCLRCQMGRIHATCGGCSTLHVCVWVCVRACMRARVCVCERERDWDIDDLLYTSQMTFHNERKSDPLYKAISWTTNTKKWNRNQIGWIPRHSPANHECISQISVLVLSST